MNLTPGLPEPASISAKLVVFWTCVTLWLWPLCWWLPFWLVVLYLTPFLITSVFLLHRLTHGRVWRWRLAVRDWVHDLSLILMIFLSLAAPLSSYFYGRWIAGQFVQELGVRLELIDQRISILEQFGFGERRGVYSTYKMLEPLEEAQATIIARIEAQGKPTQSGNPVVDLGWQIGNTRMTASCESKGAISNEIRIQDDAHLFVQVLHHSSGYCRLKHNR
jgi:hypothetical protein